MKWYLERMEHAETLSPILSVCGDDCAVCPRFLAETEEELHETALFWYRCGWRNRVVSNDEIRCRGCGTRPSCTFQLLPCVREHGVKKCSSCPEFECEKVKDTLTRSAKKQQQCRAACENEREYALLCRAFYEKEKNECVKVFL